MKKEIGIGLLGLGVVGSAVADVLDAHYTIFQNQI